MMMMIDNKFIIKIKFFLLLLTKNYIIIYSNIIPYYSSRLNFFTLDEEVDGIHFKMPILQRLIFEPNL